MKRTVLYGGAVAAALILGLIGMAMRGDGTPTRATGETSTIDGGTMTLPGGANAGEAADGASVDGSSETNDDDSSSSASSADDDVSTSSQQSEEGSPLDDLPVPLGPLTKDGRDALCTTEEREAIEVTAAGLRASILDEAEAAKESLLDDVGVGALLGVSDAVQAQLDAIDADAQDQLDDVDEQVGDAIELCEAGGDPLAAF